MKTTRKSFRAKIERTASRLNWLIVKIPFDVAKSWGTRGIVRATGEVNGFAFRSSLFPTGDGHHVLLVSKKMAKGGGTRFGAEAEFVIEPDQSERVITIPDELAKIFAKDAAMRRWFDRLSFSIRNWLTTAIASLKSADARRRRAEQVAENLLEAMEAEHELPPLLRAAFIRNPDALMGWRAMTPLQRRHQLLAIFSYRSHEARLRRLEKVIEAAVEHYERKKQKD